MDKKQETTSRWEQRKEKTRHRLLETANRLFLANGFDATTVEAIAKASDVAKGTFFNYFDSKELLLAILISKQVEKALESLPGEGSPAPERIRLTLKQTWDSLYPYRTMTRHIIAQTTLQSKHKKMPGPNALPHADHRKPLLVETLTLLIQQGQAEGTFRAEADAEVAALFLATYFFRLCVLDSFWEQPSNGWEKALEKGLDLIYHGLSA